MKTDKISSISRILAVIGSVFLVISLFVPLWKIDLDAPQYPEGLGLILYPHKIGGDVEIINGLNHYIGMQTLHTENFFEFTLLPYIISFYALLILSIALIGKRKFLYFAFGAFVLFGIVAMADFWRWEYNYGHNLDPNAAIIVPGMAYQPPLIGFKQLLNFGAYSMPATGGWLFVGTGLLLLLSIAMENNWFKKKGIQPKVWIIGLFMISFLSACQKDGPEKINLHKDKCDYCKMSIADGRFAGEVITQKGRIYKFDDLSCLSAYTQENNQVPIASQWICDFQNPGILLAAEGACYLQSDEFKSPMGGNTAAFPDKSKAQAHASNTQIECLNWQEVQNKK